MKHKVGTKVQVEASICNAYLTEAISNFLADYFGEDVDIKARVVWRNVIVGVDVSNSNIPAIFFENVGYATPKGNSKYLDDQDYRLALSLIHI